MLVRLEELSEARQSVVNRVKAAEKERDGLEGAKAVAEAYLSKERECTISQSTIFQIFVRDGQARHGTSMHSIERLLKQPPGEHVPAAVLQGGPEHLGWDGHVLDARAYCIVRERVCMLM